MARRQKKRSQVVREQDAAEHTVSNPQPIKHLQEVDFYTLWNQCKASPNYDVKTWVAAEAALSQAFGIPSDLSPAMDADEDDPPSDSSSLQNGGNE